MPGSYNVVCGQPAAVKVVGRTLEEMLVSAPVGMKISFGERPKGAYGNRKEKSDDPHGDLGDAPARL